jgi:hypothetical protein
MHALMLRLRHFACALVGVAAVFGFAAPHALAATTPPPDCTATPTYPTGARAVVGAHFVVVYTDDPAKPDYINQIQAGNVLATAERAYDSYTAAGFPTPVVGGSGKTELYILDLSQWNLSAVECYGFVIEDKTTVTGDDMPFSVSEDIFTQVELNVGFAEDWLLNGIAAWASWRALGYPAESIGDLGPFDMTLDCYSAVDKANCSSKGYENLGNSRWPFYEYLTEKYGPLFVLDVVAAAQAAGSHGLPGLQNALIAKGTTLGAEYAAYAAKLLSGGWTATVLNAATIPVTGAKIQTGASSGAIPTQSFGINHLSSKFVQISRGDGAGDHACYAATLTLSVQIPAGVTSQPTFYWADGTNAAVPLTVNGNTATTTVPWDTCLWSSTKGYLALPNTSLVDGKSFVVSGTLTVDFNTPASSAVPPAPATTYGPVIDASSLSTAPDLDLFGPQVIKLSSQDTQLRLIVNSSDEGSMVARLGGQTLGTVSLRPGGNDVRLKLPTTFLRSLRRASSTLVLTLTPTTKDGKVAGQAVTRNVTVTQPSPKRRLKRSK